MDIAAARYALNKLASINVLLGKNGCGKSTILKAVDVSASAENEIYGNVRYITPERGGALNYDPGVDHQISQNIQNLFSQRRKNQFHQFRQQSMALYRKLETLTLREIESDPEKRADIEFNFDVVLTKINGLLDNIQIRRSDMTFQIFTKNKEPEAEIKPDMISSGESELISLAIECLVFRGRLKRERQICYCWMSQTSTFTLTFKLDYVGFLLISRLTIPLSSLLPHTAQLYWVHSKISTIPLSGSCLLSRLKLSSCPLQIR